MPKKKFYLKKDQQLFNVTGDLLFVEWPVIYYFWILDLFHILCGAFAQEDSDDISKKKVPLISLPYTLQRYRGKAFTY